MDVRADTLAGGTGTHYSGKPAIGGVTDTLSDGTKRVVVGYEDNRTDASAASGACGYSNSTSQVRVCGQSYNVNEVNGDQTGDWTVRFKANQAATLTVNADLVEWDGTQIAKNSSSQTWNACDTNCSELQTISYPHNDGTDPPPSDTVGNVTMRRYRVRLTWVSGSVIVSYDDTGVDSRLEVGVSAYTDSIDTVPSGLSNNLSAVSDGTTVHLAYVKSGSPHSVAYQKRTGTTWGGTTQLPSSTSDNQAYVSLSLDSATGDLWALWTDVSGADRHIWYRVYDASATSWLTQEDWQTSNVNTNVTSNYSGASRIFAAWTVGDGSPFHVSFSTIIIPEFLWFLLPLGPILPLLLRRRRYAYEESAPEVQDFNQKTREGYG
jgi:hypothetical protein